MTQAEEGVTLSRVPARNVVENQECAPTKAQERRGGNRNKLHCKVKYAQLDTDQGLRNALRFGDTGVPNERGPPGWLCQGLQDCGALSSLLWAWQIVKIPLRCPSSCVL